VLSPQAVQSLGAVRHPDSAEPLRVPPYGTTPYALRNSATYGNTGVIAAIFVSTIAANALAVMPEGGVNPVTSAVPLKPNR
jgi:hypothetical protein